MKKTLNVPAELADRLSKHEDQLERIFELGLRAVDGEDREPGSEADDDFPVAWRGALEELMQQRRRASEAPSPSPEELAAHYRDELPPAEREAWLERLVLHPESVRDLVDRYEFDRPDMSAEARHETAEALNRLRHRVEHSAMRWRRPRWLAVAAVFMLAAVLTIPWLVDRRMAPAEPRQAAIIDVAASRGARPFPVSEKAREVLLILPLEVAESAGLGTTIRIFAADGEEVYRGRLSKAGDRSSRLYLSIPRERLPSGAYRIEIMPTPDPSSNVPARAHEYRFAIEASPSR